MTLLKIFNQQLEGLKTISEQIEKAILYKGWPEQKTKQAIEIVRQIKKEDLIVTGYTNYNFILLKELSITLSPDECGISGATIFHEENISQHTIIFMSCLKILIKYQLQIFIFQLADIVTKKKPHVHTILLGNFKSKKSYY